MMPSVLDGGGCAVGFRQPLQFLQNGLGDLRRRQPGNTLVDALGGKAEVNGIESHLGHLAVLEAAHGNDALIPHRRIKPGLQVTDSGYCSDANLQYLEKKKIEGSIATDRESYRGRHQPGPRGSLPQGAKLSVNSRITGESR